MPETRTRSLQDKLLLFSKGMAMGAADAVPGVSGGTIAFICGIYEELINSIKAINLSALRTLVQDGPVLAWQHINGNFLLVLSCGILSSLFLFASSVQFLLAQYPRFLMSFFVGLIIASCWYMLTQISRWNKMTVFSIIAGLALALGLAFLPISNEEPGLVYLFFCGALAICAMILPGISGAFILILLGVYEPVLRAVAELDLLTLAVFMTGCVSGLIAFSNFLSFLFLHYRESTLAFLLGVLAGSLYAIWPWRIEGLAAETTMSLAVCLLLALFGFFLVYGLERYGSRDQGEKPELH